MSRAVRFASGLTIATLSLRTFGVELWGVAALALAAADLLAMFDLAVAELCVYEAAKQSEPRALAARLAQALWLLVPPILLGPALLLLFARHHEFVAPLQAEHGRTLARLLLALAAAYPFVLLGNAYAGVLQGLGRLREMNAVHAGAGLLELALVASAVIAGRSLVEVQWWRTLGQALRCLLFALTFLPLGLSIPRLAKPRREQLATMLRYCLGYSGTKVLGNAIYRGNVPVAQLFTSSAVIGAYDAVDRLGTLLQRAANPVWDSLFQRLVSAYASKEAHERARGARDFLAGTSLLASVSACATLAILLLAPTLFPLWLGAEVGQVGITFAPWVLATWSLNLAASMCTAVLAARSTFRASNTIHGLALLISVGAILTIGPQDGRLALLLGPVVANAVLALGLMIAGCRAAGVPIARFALRVATLWCPTLTSLALRKVFELEGGSAFALAGVGCGVTLLLLWRGADMRALAAEFRARAS